MQLLTSHHAIIVSRMVNNTFRGPVQGGIEIRGVASSRKRHVGVLVEGPEEHVRNALSSQRAFQVERDCREVCVGWYLWDIDHGWNMNSAINGE